MPPSATLARPALDQPAVAVGRTGLRTLAGVAMLAALAWFAVPGLFGFYNEGFQSVTAMNALGLLRGDFGHIDALYRLNNDFFVASRFGVSVVLAGLLKLGLAPVHAFRLVMLASLAGLLWANAHILRRHYRIDPLFALLPALMFPAVFESAWFFNDNVLSAALSSTALAVFWPGAGSRRNYAATAASGVLWGLAIACRTDAVLLAPAFLALAWFGIPHWRGRAIHLAVAAPLVAATPLLVYAAFGLHFLDILPLTRRATLAWDRHETFGHMVTPFLKGFAWPGLLLAAAGALAVLAGRRWREAVLCLAVPALFFAAYGRMMTEVRYLLPLTPFFGILVLEGWRAILRTRGRLRTAGLAAVAAALLACFAPPVVPPVPGFASLSTDTDMPRPFLGRFWSPALSIWWNRRLQAGYAATADALDTVIRAGGGIVVSTWWTPDRNLDLMLMERGFAVGPAPAACGEIGERWTRGGDRILHLRAHIPMLPTEREAVTWRALGVPCLRGLGVADTAPVLVAGQKVLLDPMPDAPGGTMLYAAGLDIHPWARAAVGRSRVPWVAVVPAGAVGSMLHDVEPLDAPGAADWALAHRDLLR